MCFEAVIAAVEQSVEEDPYESNSQRAQQLELCPFTLSKILRKDFGWRAYEIQLAYELKPKNNQARRTFGEWAQNDMATDSYFRTIVCMGTLITYVDDFWFQQDGHIYRYTDENILRILGPNIRQFFRQTFVFPVYR